MNKSNYSKSVSANTSSSITSTTSANSGLSSNLSSSTVGYSSTISSSSIYGYDDASYGDSLWEYTINKLNLSDDTINKIVEKILDSDDDLLPLVKNYLIKYLDQVMDNPEEIIKDLIKEKDTEISRLREELDSLTKRLEKLEKERPFNLGELDLKQAEINTETPGSWSTTQTTSTNWLYDPSTTSTCYSQSTDASYMKQSTIDRLQKKICEGLEKLSASKNTTSRNDPNPY